MEKRTIRGRISRRKALRYRSLFLFTQSNSFRHKCVKLVNHASFEAFVLISIIVSSCLIGLSKTTAIIVVDMILNCIFLFELIAKVIAYGFMLHPGAYLRDPLNVLDASIVLTGFAASVKTILGDKEDLNLLILRLPRIFRPLRLMVVAKELRIVLDAIVKSSLALFHVAVFILLLLTLYAIVGLELFSGKLHHACHNITTMTLSVPNRACRSQKDQSCGSMAICVGNWTGPNLGMTSFDNIGYSLLAVFQIITLEDWVPIYYYLSDVLRSKWHSLFFVTLILLGAYFSLDLLLGVLTNQYIRTKDIVTLKQKRDKASVKKLHSALNVMQTWFWGKTPTDLETSNCDSDSKQDEDETALDGDGNVRNSGNERQNLNDYLKEKLMKIKLFPKAPKVLSRLLESEIFFYTIMVTIALNSACLAASGTKVSTDAQKGLDTVTIVCNAVFLVEHFIKLWVHGVRYYLEVKIRLLDGIVVLLSMADLTYSNVNGQNSAGISIIRALCLLRLFKGTKLGTSLLKMQDSFIRSSRSIFSLWIVLLLTLFIYAMLGNHLFKNVLKTSDERVGSFASARESLLLVFVLLTGEGWPGIMAELVDEYWKYNKARVIIPVLYILSLIILGNFILLNIFLGIMIENLTAQSQEEIYGSNEEVNSSDVDKEWETVSADQEDVGESISYQSSCRSYKSTKIKCKSCTPENSTGKHIALNITEQEDTNVELKENYSTETTIARKMKHHRKIKTRIAYSMSVRPEMDGNIPQHNSMFIFTPKNKLRVICYDIANNVVFQNLSLGSIIISTILLAFEDPLNRDEQLSKGLKYCDYLFTGIFILEIVVKAVAYGLVFGHPACYLRDKLNAIDIIVTLLSLVSLCIEAAGVNLPLQLKVLRVLRVLRTLKISQELRYVVDCLVASIAKIFNYFLLYLFLLFIYSVIGVKLYSGKLQSCTENSTQIAVNWTIPQTDCKDIASNFNHVLNAMMTLFSIGTLDNWTTDIQTIIKSVHDVTTAATYFFLISFILVMTFIMLNVFVGFVAVAFQIERGKQEGFCVLTKHAQDCIRMALQIKLEPTKHHGTAVQRKLRRCLDSVVFEYVILLCVTLNCVIMMTKHHNQSSHYDTLQEISNLFFTSLFTIESLLKLFALPPTVFFKDPWSVFDLLLVIGSWVDVTLLFFKINIQINLTVFRLFRAVRVFRVICKKGNLRQILATFIESVKSVPSIVFLVILVLFIYAVMGMQLFGRIRLEDGAALNRQVHFQNFETALIVLLRTTTLDNWRELMIACSDRHTPNCIDAPSENCGTLLSYPFFASFIFLSAFMITNLFLAVIMDNFMYLTLDSSIVYCQHIHHFMGIWREFDPGESGKIHESYVVSLLRKLPPPLGFGQHCPRRTVYAKLVTINVPVDDEGKVFYNELLILQLLYCLGLRGQNKLVRKDILALHANVDIAFLDKILPINQKRSNHSDFRVFCASNAIKYHFRVFVEFLKKVRKQDENHDFLLSWKACISEGKRANQDNDAENGFSGDSKRSKDSKCNGADREAHIKDCKSCCEGETAQSSSGILEKGKKGSILTSKENAELSPRSHSKNDQSEHKYDIKETRDKQKPIEKREG